MALTDFVEALERELRRRGVSFRPDELLAFVRRVWPLAEDSPDVSRWAERFLDTGHPDGAL